MLKALKSASALNIYKRMLKQILPYKKWIFIGIIGTLIYAGMEASLIYLVKHIINNILVDRYSLITMGMPFIIMAVFFPQRQRQF